MCLCAQRPCDVCKLLWKLYLIDSEWHSHEHNPSSSILKLVEQCCQNDELTLKPNSQSTVYTIGRSKHSHKCDYVRCYSTHHTECLRTMQWFEMYSHREKKIDSSLRFTYVVTVYSYLSHMIGLYALRSYVRLFWIERNLFFLSSMIEAFYRWGKCDVRCYANEWNREKPTCKHDLSLCIGVLRDNHTGLSLFTFSSTITFTVYFSVVCFPFIRSHTFMLSYCCFCYLRII